MRNLLLRAVPVAALLLPLAACKVDLFGPPPRPSTDGYTAVVMVTEGDKATSFDVAARGEGFWRKVGKDERSTFLLRPKAGGPVYEVDPEAKTYWETAPERILEGLDGFPLTPGFNEAKEAARRGLTKYARESDAVFAGHACAIWRFDENPEAFNSPSATYWVSPSLEGLVVRLQRSVPGADGLSVVVSSVEMTSIRPGVVPERFMIPKGFRQVSPPAGKP